MGYLRKRRRSKPPPSEVVSEEVGGWASPQHLNALLTWGKDLYGKLGGGYTSPFPNIVYAFPQGVIDLTKVMQADVASSSLFAIDDDAKVYGVTNGESWNAGQGVPNNDAIGQPEAQYEDPTRIRGGVPLCPAETLTWSGHVFNQQAGPVGPILRSKGEVEEGHGTAYPIFVSTATAHTLIFLSDGTALAFGSNNSGNHGNGWQTDAAGAHARAKDADLTSPKSQGAQAQMAPWPVCTGPGPKILRPDTVNGEGEPVPGGQWEIAPGETNVLKGIKCGGAAEHLSVFVLENNEVWYCGQPQGKSKLENGGRQLYAEKDPVWDPTNPAHLPPGYDVIAIAVQQSHYELLLSNGTTSENLCRFVGNNADFCAGDGKEASASTATREVLIPKTDATHELKGVSAIAASEYANKYLKAGVLYTSGDNFCLQQGLGSLDKSTHSEYCVPITSLNAGGREVIAVSSKGENVLGPEGFTPGVNGTDQTIVLLDDRSIRCFGMNHLPSTGAGEAYERMGTIGDGTTEHKPSPTEPLGNLRGVRYVFASGVVMGCIAEPASPPTPTLITEDLGNGNLLVKWREPAGTPGTLPLWRHAHGWLVKVEAEGPGGAFSVSSGILEESARQWLVKVPQGRYYHVTVSAQETEEKPAVIGGPVKIAVGGVVTVAWADPVLPCPGFINEYQYVKTYESKGKAKKEDWVRVTPEAGPLARSQTYTLAPPKHVLTGPGDPNEVNVRVTESQPGCFQKRSRQQYIA